MIPAFVNSESAARADICRVLTEAGGFAVEEVAPSSLSVAVRRAVLSGARRVAVAGGDGSVGSASRELAGTRVELAVIPGGTLNHLAGDIGVPSALVDAVAIARNGVARSMDVARVNGVVFLNTSSVGSYVKFVENREMLEPRLGYRTASAIAATRILFRLHSQRVKLEVDGVVRRYSTPLVFIGVGERELRLPKLGKRVPDWRSGLHVMVVRRRSGARVLSMALAAATRGVESVARTPSLDAFMVDRCTIETSSHRISLDGELVSARSPLEYELQRGALRVVVPAG